MSEDEDDRPIERKFVFICIKPETRDSLNHLKKYRDTYDTVITMLLHQAFEVKAEDFAAQNVDDTRDENG